MKTGKRIQSITIKHILDTDPDTSYLGEYSNNADSEFAIDRKHSLTCPVNTHCNDSVIEQLERAVAYLVKQRLIVAADPNDTTREAIDEAEDILIALQDDLAACDCDESGDARRNEYRYFNPVSVESFNPSTEWLAKVSESERRAYWERTMRENAKQDYARMEAYNRGDWQYVGVRVVAKVVIGGVGQTLESGGLWGIESDSGEDYLAEVGRDELAGLKKALYDIGFSRRAIATTCKSVKTKDE